MVSCEVDRTTHGVAGLFARLDRSFAGRLSCVQLRFDFLADPIGKKRFSQDGPPRGIDAF
jgi:hypothetical protein